MSGVRCVCGGSWSIWYHVFGQMLKRQRGYRNFLQCVDGFSNFTHLDWWVFPKPTVWVGVCAVDTHCSAPAFALRQNKTNAVILSAVRNKTIPMNSTVWGVTWQPFLRRLSNKLVAIRYFLTQIYSTLASVLHFTPGYMYSGLRKYSPPSLEHIHIL